jgi:glycosyltransferase A (GT-A) superfamily protein (DUF2064 family)
MSTRSAAHVLVMAKAPTAGRVKTRLCPPMTPSEAAVIAEAALADTLEAVAGCGADHKVLALDGAPSDWLPEGVRVVQQRGRGLAERLAHAWADAGRWGVQIGMDTPQVTAADLDGLLESVLAPPRGARDTAVLGLAPDGGWWTIGLQGTDPGRVFRGVPMSTPHTGWAQAERLRALGLHVRFARPRRDIDTAADLAAVAPTIPGSRTAAAWCQWMDACAPKAS